MTAREIALKLAAATHSTTGAEYHAADGKWLPALQAIHDANEQLIAAAQELAQEAFNDGATKTAIAAALGVPATTFRGMTKTRLP